MLATIGALPQPFAYAGPPTAPQIRARPTGGGRVPVTARLSKRFYDVFGEEIATELVDWFNAVDATYRADLRQLNELNFARFDAKLQQRIPHLDAKLERRMAEFRVDLKAGLSELGAVLRTETARGLGALKADLLKWMFGFWATTALALAALVLRSN